MPKEEKRGRGQPPHKPDERSRTMVQVLKANGNTHRVIALVVGIDVNTLMKHYRKELDDGFDNIKARVGAAVVKSALGGNIGAQRYWLACFGDKQWKPNIEDAMMSSNGNTTIIVRGGIASVQPEQPKTNGHDAANSAETK